MNLRELRQLSAKYELSLNFIAKDLMISKALYYFQDIPKIILKGGTAINRVYLKEERRFSEDIDFDFNSGKSPKQIVEETNDIMNKIHEFKIAKPRIMHSLIRYDLFYINPLNHRDKIRVEFNVKKVTERYSKKIVNFGFVPYKASLLNVYEKDVLIKQKLACLIGRKEGKDIYDLYYLMPFKVSNPKKIIKKLSELDIKSVRDVANHYIPKQLRPDWEMMVKELISGIQ